MAHFIFLSLLTAYFVLSGRKVLNATKNDFKRFKNLN